MPYAHGDTGAKTEGYRAILEGFRPGETSFARTSGTESPLAGSGPSYTGFNPNSFTFKPILAAEVLEGEYRSQALGRVSG